MMGMQLCMAAVRILTDGRVDDKGHVLVLIRSIMVVALA